MSKPLSADGGSRRWRGALVHLVPGALVLIVVLAGIGTSLMPSSVTHARAAGVADQRTGKLQAAVAEYQEVLNYDPEAAYTRGLLACVLWRQRKFALAAEEVYRAVREGWVLRLQGACGAGVNLGHDFAVAPLGATEILVIYTPPGQASLVATARDTAAPLFRRFAAAACLGLNAGFVAFGVEPINQAGLLNISAAGLNDALRRCLTRFSQWFTCTPPGSDNCLFSFTQELIRRRELHYVGISGG